MVASAHRAVRGHQDDGRMTTRSKVLIGLVLIGGVACQLTGIWLVMTG